MDMSMLPSAAAESEQPHVLVYLITSDSADLSQLAVDLGGQLHSSVPALLTLASQPNLAIAIHTQSQIDPRIIESCDALVVALDGSSGVGPETFKLWHLARDQSLPRHFLATNTVHGRADFDELSAIATRTMEPDLMIRYLPIDSDDETSLAGIYDLLTSEIQTGSPGNWITKSADPEHITITSTAREDLFDHLAYLGLDDATLENHRAGLPISIIKLESAWYHPDVVSITPIDYQIGIKVFSDWIAKLSPHWLPSVVTGEETCDVLHTNERIGFSVTESLVRMWGESNGDEIGVAGPTGDEKLELILETPAVLISMNLAPGATVRTADSKSYLVTPAF
jgi:hypothetical protein